MNLQNSRLMSVTRDGSAAPSGSGGGDCPGRCRVGPAARVSRCDVPAGDGPLLIGTGGTSAPPSRLRIGTTIESNPL